MDKVLSWYDKLMNDIKETDLKINVPTEFYNEEARYGGYVVSSQMKQMWAVQIDLLKEFERVCEKLNLRYSMHSGSMLGAVRHQGFIPWDDIYIFMPRKDYNILLKNTNEFEYPYFLQSPYTDRGAFEPSAKFMNLKTTALHWVQKYTKIRHGIFIDIFVADEFPNGKFERFIKKIRTSIWYYLSYVPFRANNTFRTITKFKGRVHCPLWPYRHFEKICSKSSKSGADELTLYVFGRIKFNKCKSNVFDNIKEVPFEFTTCKLVEDYDYILKTAYGSDYMTPRQIPSRHANLDGTGMFIDPDNPYTKYQ